MYQEVVRTQEEIDDLRDQVMHYTSQGSTKFSGMSYEDGLDAGLEWLLYRDEQSELEYGGPMDE